MVRRMKMRIGVIILAAVSIAALAAWASREREWRYSAPAMGARASLTLVGSPLGMFTGALNDAAKEAFAEVGLCEKLMTIYDPQSDIGRVNAAEPGREIAVDGRTYEALQDALEAERVTRGAFDVSILPAEERWGFKTDRARRAPGPGEAPAAGDGGPRIALRKAGGRCLVRLLKKGAGIDLGGIAPGYAADRVAKLLEARGIKNAMIDVGGECYCLGRGPGGSPWRVGIRNPRGEGMLAVLELRDMAVATSGDYEDFFMEGGRRYSHIFDPRTERPAATGVVSSTVIARSCAEADALSTAILVLGREEGMKLAGERDGVECLMVSCDGVANEDTFEGGSRSPRPPDDNGVGGEVCPEYTLPGLTVVGSPGVRKYIMPENGLPGRPSCPI